MDGDLFREMPSTIHIGDFGDLIVPGTARLDIDRWTACVAVRDLQLLLGLMLQFTSGITQSCHGWPGWTIVCAVPNIVAVPAVRPCKLVGRELLLNADVFVFLCLGVFLLVGLGRSYPG